MTELLNQLVIAAQTHALIVTGEGIHDDAPDDDEDFPAWLASIEDTKKVLIVTSYLKSTI